MEKLVSRYLNLYPKTSLLNSQILQNRYSLAANETPNWLLLADLEAYLFKDL